ncbi:LamG-like jellyroll fold domain-containing protein [Streptomyces sp. NPDC087437]|uniref:LamG-like jellyroll fold domain-containing protein n=1 Tax=Streptomyces sp. NPDC087437 TaxID=3365789 RepID=UPI003819BA01
MFKNHPRASLAGGLLAAAFAGGLLTPVSAQAVTGTAALEGEYAFTAKLDIGSYENQRACSGVLVNTNWVLTAASCFTDDPSQDPQVAAGKPKWATTATIGRTDLSKTAGQVRQVTELVPHGDRDLVLARLATPVTNITPIMLGSSVPTAGEELRSTGYGRTKNEWVPNRLHSGAFNMDSVGSTEVNITGRDGAAVCLGDTGGPVFRVTGGKAELVAVNSRSWQGGCLGNDETRTGAVSTRTDDVTGWIQRVRLAGKRERAEWRLDEAAGATQAQGSTPPRSAALHGGATTGVAGKKGTALQLDGVSGYASSDLAVVDTDRGFSVSAWVKLDRKPTAAAIAVTQPGKYNPGFELYYSAAYDRWVFNQFSADTSSATPIRAMAAQAGGVTVGAWTHLVGLYDGTSKTLRLYVDNKLVGETPVPKAWNAQEGLVFGAGRYDGVMKSFFPGAIDEVQLFDKPLSAAAINKIYSLQQIGDPGRPAEAVFTMDEKPGATGVDGYGDVLPAKFFGGVTRGVAGIDGNAASFNGTDGYARIGQTDGPHLNTQQNFTVSAWAKLDRKPTSGAGIIFTQAGVYSPAIELYYSVAYDRWAFNQYSADTADAKPIRAMQPDGTTAQTGVWVHLVGVHDVKAQTLTLYVNGTKAGQTTLSKPFYGGQSSYIGVGSYSGQLKSYFPGTIDDIRLYTTTLTADEVRQLSQQKALNNR